MSGWGLAAGPAVAGAVLADPAEDGLGLAAGELDGLALDGLGLAGEVDGPRVAPGGPDGLGLDGLGVDGLGRGVRLAHAPGLVPATLAAARLGPAVGATVWLDGLALGLAGDALVGLGLGLTVGDELLGLGLTAGDELVELGLTLGDELAGLGLAGLDAGAATAGVDDTQPAAACP